MEASNILIKSKLTAVFENGCGTSERMFASPCSDTNNIKSEPLDMIAATTFIDADPQLNYTAQRSDMCLLSAEIHHSNELRVENYCKVESCAVTNAKTENVSHISEIAVFTNLLKKEKMEVTDSTSEFVFIKAEPHDHIQAVLEADSYFHCPKSSLNDRTEGNRFCQKRIASSTPQTVGTHSKKSENTIIPSHLNGVEKCTPTGFYKNAHIKLEPNDEQYSRYFQGSLDKTAESTLEVQHIGKIHQNTNHGSQATTSLTDLLRHSCSKCQTSVVQDGKLGQCVVLLERLHPTLLLNSSQHLSGELKDFKAPIQKSSLVSVEKKDIAAGRELPSFYTSLISHKIGKCPRPGKRPYQCKQCDLAYKTASALSQHKKVHLGLKEHECKDCGKAFTYKSTLTSHMRTHTNERPYKCHVCGYAFRWSSHLNTHMITHTTEKPYQCELCGTCFTQRGNLRMHMQLHAGYKPHQCDQCDAAFTQSCQLKIHMRIHTGERPYKCDLCNAAFSHGNTLIVHKRMHSGEKPYQCEECGASFSQSTHLRTHQKVHSKPKSVPEKRKPQSNT